MKALALPVSAVAAAVITFFLFIMMGALIVPKKVELGESEFRTLERITPQEQRRKFVGRSVRQLSGLKPLTSRLHHRSFRLTSPMWICLHRRFRAQRRQNFRLVRFQASQWTRSPCLTAMLSRSVRRYHLTRPALRNVVLKVNAKCVSTWIHVASLTTSQHPVRIACSHAKLSVR